MKNFVSLIIVLLLLSSIFALPMSVSAKDNDVITLRVSNCEEYIDEGNWNTEDTIDLDSGDIIGNNSMITDFENWYFKTYGKKIKVEYSTYGTNEDLYNQITLGDTFDIVCPSDYMGMKMIDEDMLVPLSQEFFDTDNEYNYYAKGVSPYIKNLMDTTKINGKTWSDYSAGYMWGTMGFVYNPEIVSNDDASTWKILENEKYNRQITIKDSVRDTYFAVLGLLNSDLMSSENFKSSDNYNEQINKLMNDTSEDTVNKAEKRLQNIRNNVYSFETDSGKSDMVSGKVVANFQWSGDAVYSLDQAEEDGCFLEYAVPNECSNLWCDGWVMLKSGINGDKEKQNAAEAFINFLSRPDNVIRDMYYIGYTSCISGGDDNRIFEYVNWCYAADEDEESVDYPVGFFFTGNSNDKRYIVKTTEDQTRRQLYSQYPTEDVLNRCAVMMFFDNEANERMNQMWINVRCFNINSIPTYVWWIVVAVIFVVILLIVIYTKGHIIRGIKMSKKYTKL